MNRKQFRQELDFSAAMSIAGKLLEHGQITTDEYRQVEAALVKKYRPVIWSLKMKGFIPNATDNLSNAENPNTKNVQNSSSNSSRKG